MTSIYQNKAFARFAGKQRIDSKSLCEAVHRAEQGSVDADLGGSVIKQRIARPGAGKSGGFRSIVLFRKGDRAVFAYGFPKSAQDNITAGELKAFKELAKNLLSLSDVEIGKAVANGTLTEIDCDDEEAS